MGSFVLAQHIYTAGLKHLPCKYLPLWLQISFTDLIFIDANVYKYTVHQFFQFEYEYVFEPNPDIEEVF